MNDGGRIHSARATEKLGALEQTDVCLRVKAILTACASGGNETESFPGTKYRGRYSDEARDFADVEIARSALRFAGQLTSVSQTSFLLTRLQAIL